MNAQELLDQVETKNEIGKEGCFALFYPSLYQQKLADRNLTKCLKEMK